MFKIPLADVAQLPKWAWENRGRFLGIPADPDEFVEAFLSEEEPCVRRVGSTLRLPPAPDGGRQLAFLGQTAHNIAAIKRAISGGLDVGQKILSGGGSLQSLQNVSMVTLGLTALTPLILAAQFKYLRRRFDELQKDIKKLEQLLDTRYVSELESGIEILESGVRQHKKDRIEAAQIKCNDAAVFFGNRVQTAVAEQQDRRGILLLSRHLSVAVCGSTRCFIALEEDAEARKTLDARSPALRAAAKAVFQKTVARNPERFLVPELAEEVSLEALVALFQQAKHAGALDESDAVQQAVAGQHSASRFFETIRPQVFRRRWWWVPRPSPDNLRAELRDATACVEETNRVLSLGDYLDQSNRADKKAIEGLSWFDKEATEEAEVSNGESPFFVWGY